MPRYFFGRYAIEIRTNEHNHKGQRAHVHVYVHGKERASMFLDGTIRDGRLTGKALKELSAYILRNAEDFQKKWDEFQESVY